jgi:glycosyltransferase involved in cell wall biosynthesis
LKKLAIISSHPIQYNAPLFALLAKEDNIDLKVFYTWGVDSIEEKYDPDFQQNIQWDIPLLEGYQYQFLENTSKDPGSHHFKGIINPELNQEIEKWGADIVWVWGWAFDSHLKALRYFKGKKEVWFRGDSTLLDEPKGFSVKKILRRVFLTWVYRHVDKAFYVGTHNKAYFVKHGLKETQLVYAPHAIDNDRFADLTGEYSNQAKDWRKELGISENQKVILFAGKLETKKNPFFLITLAKELPTNEYKIVFVGSGPLEENLKNQATENCIFLGFQNQKMMPIVYRLADVFVLPSLGPGETWGLAINEALACGIPVIASNKCGGAVDLINTETGFMYNGINLMECLNWLQEQSKTKQTVIFNSTIIQKHSYQTINLALEKNVK